MLKKLLPVLILTVLIFNTPVAFGSTFKDVPSTHTNYQDIEFLSSNGIIKGYSDNTFKPNGTVTNAQVAIMMARALEFPTSKVTNPGYKDVSENHPAYKEISTATNLGLFTKKQYFKPNDPITRGEMAQVLVNGFNLSTSNITSPFSDVPSSYEYSKHISILYSLGITKGYENKSFKPKNSLTRAEFSAFLNRVMQINNTTEMIDENNTQITVKPSNPNLKILNVETFSEDYLLIYFNEPNFSQYSIKIDGKTVNHVTHMELEPMTVHKVYLNQSFLGSHELQINILDSEKPFSSHNQNINFKKDSAKPEIEKMEFKENQYGTMYLRIFFNEDISIPNTLQNLSFKFIKTDNMARNIRGNGVKDKSSIVPIGNMFSFVFGIEKNELPVEYSLIAEEDVLWTDLYGNKGPKEIHIKFDAKSLTEFTYEVEEVY
ncbi:S-layer homology domain-containing protein [Lysinibacillus fusiformis]|uniref:S-layer homology domain-containing protein n=1 Tax=Lysinibacillus fusiformis TaxID=28031 RepID=UPI001967A880|nr:S-layer homology domain-containing protein [Lysinibacillus fusiformis]QSB11980.1 S-layer homology domain-containing protein [Lysinibacillus fusiformis]